MARISKFVKIRGMLQAEIQNITKKQNYAVIAEDYAMAAVYKGFRDTLNLLNEITKEREGGVENE